VSGEWHMRQSEGKTTANRLPAAALTALFIASRRGGVRWGSVWARSITLLLKTTLLIPLRMCSGQSIARVGAGAQWN